MIRQPLSFIEITMPKKFTLYWSSLEMYERCPQQFLWTKGWEGVDFGQGVGEKMPIPVKSSMHHAVMGIVIGQAMEDFYNLQLWKDPNNLQGRLEAIVRKEFDIQTNKKYIDWEKAPSEDEMLQVCLEGIRGFLHTMKHHKLLGEYSRSEVDMVAFLKEGHPIGGRADLIIKRKGVVGIYDGKNSQSKGKYTSPDQLKWYALLYMLCTKEIPHKLGFIYYRYPYGKETKDGVEEGVDFVEFNDGDLSLLAERAINARNAMNNHIFPATPKAKHCQFCNFETICEDRKKQRESNSLKRAKSFSKKLGISNKDNQSFVEFTLPK